MSDLIVYRWPDGSRVTCEVDETVSQGVFRVVHVGGVGGVGVEELWIDPSSKGVMAERYEAYPEEVRRYVLGFLLDLGLDRKVLPLAVSGLDLHLVSLVSSAEYDDLAPYPLFVPDDRYASRHEDARRRVGRPPGRFLSWEQVEVFSVGGPGREGDSIPPTTEEKGLIHVMEGNATAVGEGRTVEEAVDNLCENLFVLPESSRRTWEAEHVLRGEWVLPSLEEVEVYRTLGEELPFWWAPDKLSVWLSERAT